MAATVVISTMLAGWVSSTTSATQNTIANRTSEGVSCAAAEIVIDDAYITTGSTSETASVILRNSGGTDDLTITSAQLYNKNGDNITATNVPISNFDRGATSTLSFSFKPAGDSSKYGNNGTLFNGPVLSSGRYGSAMSFDGINDYVNISFSQSLNFTENVTVVAWTKANSFDPTLNWKDNIVSTEAHQPANNRGFTLRAGIGNIDFVVGTGDGFSNVLDKNLTMSTNQWYYLVGWGNRTLLKAYINGILRNSSTLSLPMQYTSAPLVIGDGSYGASGRNFNGTIDEVAIWNRSLTDAEINTSMNQGPLSVSNTNDLVGYWSFDGGIITCPNDFSRIVVTTNCGGVSAEFSKPPKCH